METNRPYKIYSKNDIKRYLSGEMSSAEMYALEKQSIEDPFLQDAIDGYNSITHEAANADIAWLQQQLPQQEEARVIDMQKLPTAKAFPWMKIAVAASLVGVLFFVAVKMFNSNTTGKETVAENSDSKSPTSANKGIVSNDSINSTANPEGASKTTTDLKKQPLGATSAESKKIYVKPDDIVDYYNAVDLNIPIKDAKPDYRIEDALAGRVDGVKMDSLPIKNGDVAKDRNAAPPAPAIEKAEASVQGSESKTNTVLNGNVASNSNVYNEVVVFDKRAQQQTNNRNVNDAEYLKRKAKDEDDKLSVSRNYRFDYTIVDEQGNSIPFTNISVPADQLVTYSRVDGKFGLFSSDSVLNVNFKAAGYVPQNVQLANKNNGKIVLQSANTNMNEVVVTSAKPALAKKSAKLQSVIEEAEPVDGISNYDHYLANNINTNQKPQGEVILSFEVGDNGEPTNIVVNKSLSSAADQEAIRLLTQGPKWKSKKRKSTKGKIVIKF